MHMKANRLIWRKEKYVHFVNTTSKLYFMFALKLLN